MLLLYLDKVEGLFLVNVVEWLARDDRGSAPVHLEGADSRHNNGAL